MPELTLQELTTKLRSERFDHVTPSMQALSDPIADTPMVVTLDELRPYELNPRITRNSKYDEIKASIRERGLDAPPVITRRPGQSHFIIRNGGNTRLSILRELWGETREERFFRIPCLFRPWSARGEIVALTGHLAENELHGDLSFIERALGVDKARELYEQETGNPLSQRELARRLTADGYPISHSLISRMQDTLRHLLPAIPTVLYAGLGKHQVERLSSLRKAAARVWQRHTAAASPTVDFGALFQDVLAGFDADPTKFDTRRAQDELLKHMASLLSSDYDTLALEVIDAEGLSDAINRDPAGQPALNPPFPVEDRAMSRRPPAASAPRSELAQPRASPARSMQPLEPQRSGSKTPRAQQPTSQDEETFDDDEQEFEDEVTDDQSSTVRSMTDGAGEEPRSRIRDEVTHLDDTFRGEELTSTATLWHIAPSIDTPDALRSEIARLATHVAQEACMADRIKDVNDGVGYVCIRSQSRSNETLAPFQRSVLALMGALSRNTKSDAATYTVDLGSTLGALLQGSADRGQSVEAMPRLSDANLLNLFRLICVTRRLIDLESAKWSPSDRKSV